MESLVDKTKLPNELTEQIAEVERLAKRIRSNAHLKVIVRSAQPPEIREQVYLLVTRYVKFKPVPFSRKWAYE